MILTGRGKRLERRKRWWKNFQRWNMYVQMGKRISGPSRKKQRTLTRLQILKARIRHLSQSWMQTATLIRHASWQVSATARIPMMNFIEKRWNIFSRSSHRLMSKWKSSMRVIWSLLTEQSLKKSLEKFIPDRQRTKSGLPIRVMPICRSRRTSWFRSISRLQRHRLQIFTENSLDSMVC